MSEVVQVPDADVLRTQVAILIAGEPRVLRLGPTTFTFDDILSIGAEGTELAILGQAGSVFTGGPTNGAPPLVSVGFDSILYLSSFRISVGPVNAVNSSSGSILWLDDMRIDGYPNIGVSGTSEGHIRRSLITAGATALLWQGGSLEMHTTSLGPGAGSGFRTTGAPSLDVRYVTIAGNTTSLGCDATPGPSGVARAGEQAVADHSSQAAPEMAAPMSVTPWIKTTALRSTTTTAPGSATQRAATSISRPAARAPWARSRPAPPAIPRSTSTPSHGRVTARELPASTSLEFRAARKVFDGRERSRPSPTEPPL